MFVPAWAWRVAPYVGGLLLVAGALWWAYNRGVSAERGKWQVEVARAEKAAAAKTAALQAQVDAAGVALSERTHNVERIRERAQIITRNYYAENAANNVLCLGPDRLRHIAEADRAAEAASAAR